MPPTVVWTHRAERRLQDQLVRADGSAGGLGDALADADRRLAAAFPDAAAVVVLDQYAGFRARPGEAVLRVDVRCPHRPGTFVVKLGPDDKLRREHDAWRNCQPCGFSGNRVFMALEPRAGPGRSLAALVYQDAAPHIGTDVVVPLDDAALQAVRTGSPGFRSVLAALRDLYDQLGDVLYSACRVADPDASGVALNPGPDGRRRLAGYLDLWEREPAAVEVRQQVGLAFPPMFDRYADPVDYFRFLDAELAAGTPPGRVLPRVLRGRAHGDLHGRNVLVGVRQNRAAAPAVFDYEHMSCDNLVGWDFVKLETELKVRGLAALHRRGRLDELAARAEEFETRLADRTLVHRDAGAWPTRAAATPGERARDRLEALVLAVRGRAAEHLGDRQNRSREWLHEYYFLLACYGVCTVTFENLTPRERAAALVSAGVAAAQYEWGRARGAP